MQRSGINSSGAAPSDILSNLTRQQVLVYGVLLLTFSSIVLVLLLHPTTDHADIRANQRTYYKSLSKDNYSIHQRSFRNNGNSNVATNDHKATSDRGISEMINTYEKVIFDNSNSNNNMNMNTNNDIEHSLKAYTKNDIIRLQPLQHVAEATTAYHHKDSGDSASNGADIGSLYIGGKNANEHTNIVIPATAKVVNMIDLSYKVSPTSGLSEYNLFPHLIGHFHSNLNAALLSQKSEKVFKKKVAAESNSGTEKRTIARFHRALHSGDLCVAAVADSQFSLLASAAEDFMINLKPRIFIDVSSSYYPIEKTVAFYVARAYPSATTLLIRPPTTSADDFSDNSRYKSAYMSGLGDSDDECKSGSLSNLFIASADARPQSGRHFDCLQVLTDFSSIVNSQLPFEFEETLGCLMCRCNITTLPRLLPDTPYFSYWESTYSLISASISSYSAKYGSDSSCLLDIDVTLGFKSIYPTRIRNGYILVKRSNTTILSTKTGHISANYLYEMTLSDASKIQLLDTSLRIRSASQLSANYVLSGGSLIDANGSSTTSDNVKIKGLYVSSDVEDASSSSSALISSKNETTTTTAGFDAAVAELANVTTSTGRRRLSSTFSNSYSSKHPNYFPVVGFSSTWDLLDTFLSSLDMPDDITALFTDIDSPLEESNSGGASYAVPISDPYKVSVRKEMRLKQQSMQEREAHSYRTWLSTLLLGGEGGETNNDTPFHVILNSNLVYIFGKHITLLSVKISRALAKRQASTLVVSVLTDAQAVEPHLLLNSLMKAKNNLVCNPDISLATTAALLASPERADTSIVQSDVIIRLLYLSILGSDVYATGSGGKSLLENAAACGLETFEESFASLLLAARNSYVEIPTTSAMLRVVETLLPANSDCSPLLLVRYGKAESSILKATEGIKFGVYVKIKQLFLADRQSANSEGAYDIYHVKLDYILSSNSKYSSDKSNRGMLASRGSSDGISVYTLLHLDVVRNHKKKLLHLYIDLPLWSSASADDISPWTTFVRISELSSPSSSSSRDISLWHVSEASQQLPTSNSFFGRSSYKNINTSGARKGVSTSGIIGVSAGADDVVGERRRSKLFFSAISQELRRRRAETCGGAFSFVEHNSGYGFISALIAQVYPNATVLSLERDYKKVDAHVRLLNKLKVWNNAVCNKASTDDSTIYKNIYESPELFRFQLMSRGLLESFAAADSLDEWGTDVGTALSTAVTSFVAIPPSSQVSLAMAIFFGSEEFSYSRTINSQCGANSVVSCITGPHRQINDAIFGRGSNSVFTIDRIVSVEHDNLIRSTKLSYHPTADYADFEALFLLGSSKVKAGSTQLSFTKMSISVSGGAAGSISVPLIRCDIVNMTRKVHHHYDYAKDGHSRTYTMKVLVNESIGSDVSASVGAGSASSLSSIYTTLTAQGIKYSSAAIVEGTSQYASYAMLPLGSHINRDRVLSVHLYRDRDSFPIPYISLYGVTLISALRLGLEVSLRDRLFQSFLKLPLYEDMAPWNVILAGQRLDYIDYDTREVVFDGDVPKAYLIMTVLMNYKRTVEDFKRCGTKASTVYGLPYVSDCVGGGLIKSFTCPDMKMPVPCGDGNCHSDYISCLRSLSTEADKLIGTTSSGSGNTNVYGNTNSNDLAFSMGIADAMKKNIGMISEKGFSVFNN